MNITEHFAKKLFQLIERRAYLPRKIVLVIDLAIVVIAFSLSYYLYFQLKGMEIIFYPFLVKLLLCTSINLMFFVLFNTYQGIIRYSTLKDSLSFFSALCGSTFVLIFLNYLSTIFSDHTIFAWEYFFINFFIAFSLMFILRVIVKVIYDYLSAKGGHNQKNIQLLIYGDSSSDVSVAQLLQISPNLPYRVAGFVTDSSTQRGRMILGLPVYNKNTVLNDISLDHTIGAILIDTEQLDVQEKQILAEKCIEKKVKILSFPSPEDLSKKNSIKQLNKVSIEDLLGRATIDIDVKNIAERLSDRTVLITGAAGSIGSEIVRQLSVFKPRLLLLCDIAETPLHNLMLEMADNFPEVKIKILVADVRNRDRMRRIFETHRPEFVFHAAAYKHVPLMELNPCEAVITNIKGTINTADLAREYGSQCFVMISTDKAVRPGNVMGATKRIAEIYIQSLEGQTRFITTRFGNVLGSNGSVIPRFTEQIKRGGPITVTHPDVIRYFMTIPEACRLVLEAGTMGHGGEIFVFDMGQPVKIIDLATKMILLSGLKPYTDIDIKITGLRPGEKLHEELLYVRETAAETPNPKIKIGKVHCPNPDAIKQHLALLIEKAETGENTEVVKLMKTIVPEFISCNSEYSTMDNVV